MFIRILARRNAAVAAMLLRAHDNKTEVVIYDYVDMNEPMLANMYRKRMKGYEGMGYAISSK